jgi:hypothetical protein
MTENNSQQESRVMFDKKFKTASLVRLIMEPFLIPKYKACLYPEIFNTKEEHEPLARIAKLIVDKSNKKEPVSFEGLFGWLQLSADGPEREASLKLYHEIQENEKLWQLARSDEFFANFLDYLKMNRIYLGSQEVVNLFRKGDFQAAFEAQGKIESDTQQLNLDVIESTDWDSAFDELKKDSETRKSSGLRIGLPDFDESGGFAPQTLNVFAANTGGGKGMMTIHLARSCIMQKKPVYIAVVEDTKKMFQRRLISSMTKIPYSRVMSNFHDFTDAEKDKVRTAMAEAKPYVDIEFPFGCSYKAILERFRIKQAERKRMGLPLYEVFILDYLGHAVKQQVSANQQEYQLLTRAMRDLRDFGLVENLITFTHWQLSSGGKKKEADGELISNYDIAGATDMVNLVDNAIGINRSADNRKRDIAVLNFFKGREGYHECEFQVNTRFDVASYDMRNAQRLDIKPATSSSHPPASQSSSKPQLTGAPPVRK